MLNFPARISGYFSLVLLIALLVLQNPTDGKADTAQYYYDELGRLTQVINNAAITNYTYDEVGNILSVTNGSLSDIPAVTTATPNTFLLGVRATVEFTGQNLFSAGVVTSLSGKVAIDGATVESSKITVSLTAISAGTDTIKITFRDNANTVYQFGITVVDSTVVLTPAYIVAPADSSTSTVISLNPPLAVPLTLGLKTGNAAVATVPAIITIPAGGSATLPINTKALGYSSVTSLNNIHYGYIISEPPVSGNGVTSRPISVTIQPAYPAVPPTVNTSPPISVTIEPVYPAIVTGMKTSSPISVTIEPPAPIIYPSVTVSPNISVQIAQ